MIHPLHCAGSLYEAVAERELEPEDQLGIHRDCLVRGEESPAGPDVGYAPLLRAVAFDVVLHRDVAGNTRRVSRILMVTNDGISIYKGSRGPLVGTEASNDKIIHALCKPRTRGATKLGEEEVQ